jgi:formylmethanofuran dehydrogenase subunit E
MLSALLVVLVGQAPVPVDRLAAVAAIHGEAGPWAVAGYRMGEFALTKLGLKAQSHELKVLHRSPKSPQYACVADGAQAATGASVGKVNLAFEEAPFEQLQTTFTNVRTGASVTLKPAKVFLARFTNTSRDKAFENGKAVLALKDTELFEIVAETPAK